MLESSDWCYSLSGYGPTPFEPIEIKHKKIIEPEFAIASSKNKHLVVNDTRSMELPHRGFSSDNAGNIETELVYSLLEVNKDDI